MKVLVLPAAAQRVQSEAATTGRNETGGLLLGWRRSDLGLWVVAEVTGPGAGSKATPTTLHLDTMDLQVEADRWFEDTRGEVSYLGDWHLHHQADPVPSRQDRRSIREVARRPEIGVPEPLLVIVGKAGQELCWRAWVGAKLTPATVEVR